MKKQMLFEDTKQSLGSSITWKAYMYIVKCNTIHGSILRGSKKLRI
jgi:hypothetical protein